MYSLSHNGKFSASKLEDSLPVTDEHGVAGGAVSGQLSVARGGGHHGQLDGVERVAGQQLSVEPSVDHGGLKA